MPESVLVSFVKSREAGQAAAAAHLIAIPNGVEIEGDTVGEERNRTCDGIDGYLIPKSPSESTNMPFSLMREAP